MTNTALLSSRFRLADRKVLFGRAELFDDRLIFRGLTYAGFISNIILLKDVTSIEWRISNQPNYNFLIERKNESPLHLWIKGAGIWKFKMEALLMSDRKESKHETARVLVET